MKNYFQVRLIVFTFFLAPLALLAPQARALDGSFGLQLGYAASSATNHAPIKADSGFNFYGSGEVNLVPTLALGLSTAFTDLFKSGDRVYADGTQLYLRYSPWKGLDWSPYVSAGAGLRLFYDVDSNHRWWKGDFQNSLALGVRHPLAKDLDLDLTAFFDNNPGSGASLQTFGMRAGVSLPFDFEAGATHTAANAQSGPAGAGMGMAKPLSKAAPAAQAAASVSKDGAVTPKKAKVKRHRKPATAANGQEAGQQAIGIPTPTAK